jgi:hypothetical protein
MALRRKARKRDSGEATGYIEAGNGEQLSEDMVKYQADQGQGRWRSSRERECAKRLSGVNCSTRTCALGNSSVSAYSVSTEQRVTDVKRERRC